MKPVTGAPRVLVLVAVVAVGLVVAACQPTQTLDAVDGDTIDTELGRIRVLGIDTPEVGEPCYAEAKARVAALTVGGEVELVLNSTAEDRDHYDRLLRHVIVDGVGDLGEILIREGLANARYDSLDGYNRHMHENRYRLLDLATAHRCGPDMDAVGGDKVPVVAPPPGPSDVYYENCAAVRAAGKAPLHQGQPGYRAGLDRDGDGIACE